MCQFLCYKLSSILSPSILQKAGAALEVLRDVLDAVDGRHPEVLWLYSGFLYCPSVQSFKPTYQLEFSFFHFLFMSFWNSNSKASVMLTLLISCFIGFHMDSYCEKGVQFLFIFSSRERRTSSLLIWLNSVPFKSNEWCISPWHRGRGCFSWFFSNLSLSHHSSSKPSVPLFFLHCQFSSVKNACVYKD